MNVTFFGKTIAGIGLAVVLLTFVTVLGSRDSISNYRGLPNAQQGVDRHNAYVMQCFYSRIGESGGFGIPGCPMGGYSALSTYFGFIVVIIGGGLVLASRKE